MGRNLMNSGGGDFEHELDLYRVHFKTTQETMILTYLLHKPNPTLPISIIQILILVIKRHQGIHITLMILVHHFLRNMYMSIIKILINKPRRKRHRPANNSNTRFTKRNRKWDTESSKYEYRGEFNVFL